MDVVLEHIEAFIAKVKDDPSLSDLFRDAAQVLYDELNPAPDTPGTTGELATPTPEPQTAPADEPPASPPPPDETAATSGN